MRGNGDCLIADLGGSSEYFFWLREGMMGKGCLVNILPCVSRFILIPLGEKKRCFYSSTFVHSFANAQASVLTWMPCISRARVSCLTTRELEGVVLYRELHLVVYISLREKVQSPSL